MAEQNDFKDLLKKLKSEVRPFYEGGSVKRPSPEAGPLDVPAPSSEEKKPAAANPAAQERSYPPRAEKTAANGRGREDHREIILLGVLCSIIAVIIGVVVPVNYLTVVGSIGFAICLLAMAWQVIPNSSFKSKAGAETLDKIQELSERVSMIERKLSVMKTGYPGLDVSKTRAHDLDEKIEELRVLVKSLAKTVQGQ